MKVMIVAGYASSLINFRGLLIQELLKGGCTVIACAAADDKTAALLANWGVEFHCIPIKRAGLNPIKDAVLFLALARLCRRVRPDIVFCYTIKPVVYGSLAARLCGVTNIYALITGLGFAFVGKGLRGFVARNVACFLYKRSLKKTRCVFFQNPDDCDYFSSTGILTDQRTVVVNGSGVDLDQFSRVPLPDGMVFLLIARLLAAKGIREYAAAAAETKRKYTNVTFKLAGWLDNGPGGLKAAEVDSWVKAGTVEYLGKLEDVKPALSACSVFVLPSYREGTPRTILEAMAVGRAIITTDAPGCRETVKNGVNGLLVPVRNVQSLVKAMERFVLEPGLAVSMGIESRRFAEEKYDVHKVNTVILENMGLHEARV